MPVYASTRFTDIIYTKSVTFPSRKISGITSAFFQQDYAKKRSSFIYALVHWSLPPRTACLTYYRGLFCSTYIFTNTLPGTNNLTDYRLVGFRTKYYRDIFRHNIRRHEDFRTGGRLNVLWLDGHVSSIEETTGDDDPKRWYTGER